VTIAIRADASAATGIGHVKRCLALAEAAAAFGERTLFVCAGTLSPALAEEVRRACELRYLRPGADDAAAFLAALPSGRVDCVVVDHYQLDARWHDAVAGALRCRIAAVDDLADRSLHVDLLVDHNLSPDHRAKYRGRIGPRTRLLGGPRFALISPRYAGLAPRTPADEVSTIGVSLGGSDPAGLTSLVVEACRDVAGFAGPIEVVTTSANPRLDELGRLANERPGVTLSVDLPDLTAFHQRHDLYVGAAGGSSWERCCLGLPTLLLQVAENQRVVIDGLRAAGAASALPDGSPVTCGTVGAAIGALIRDPARRRALAEAARALVDGRGAVRVAAALLAPGLTVRPATLDDRRLMFEWRNHPETRRVSRDSAALDWANHCAWVGRVLADPQRLLLVGRLGAVDVGVIRFDRLDGDRLEVSLYLDPVLQGTGLGGALLDAGEGAALRWAGPGTVIVAHVLWDNEKSGRMFERAGYVYADGVWTRRPGFPPTLERS